jgi:photosystem II stability/assembly factor-like uncharacterized protein
MLVCKIVKGIPGAHVDASMLGLDGDRVPYVVVDRKSPSTVLAGTSQGSLDQGFFRSTDGGKTWPQAPGLPLDWATGLAVSPVQDVLLADPGVAGFQRSTDGGSTWTPTTFTSTSYGTLFDPTGNTVWASDGIYIWRSVDAGINWNKTMNTGLPTGMEHLDNLAFDGTTLYVGAAAHGVYASTDDGDTFTQVATGLPSTTVLTVAAHPSRPGFVLAQLNAEGVYRTDDSGAHWSKVDTGMETTKYMALLIDPSSPTRFYVSRNDAGLLRSTDDGKTWTAIGPDSAGVWSVDVDPQSGAVYVGTLGSGVWRFGN